MLSFNKQDFEKVISLSPALIWPEAGTNCQGCKDLNFTETFLPIFLFMDSTLFFKKKRL